MPVPAVSPAMLIAPVLAADVPQSIEPMKWLKIAPVKDADRPSANVSFPAAVGSWSQA